MVLCDTRPEQANAPKSARPWEPVSLARVEVLPKSPGAEHCV
jgi:hypothetical protein